MSNLPSENKWLREAMRLSLTNLTTTTYNTSENGPPGQRDPRFRKLIEGVLWTKKFILTYHLVVLGIIFIVSTVNWSQRAIRWRRRRLGRNPESRNDLYDFRASSPSSSGSSTLQGDENSPVLPKDPGEDTPLLASDRKDEPSDLKKRSLINSIRAFILFQPRPLPIFNKVLPENGTSICVCLFAGLNFFYTLYKINFTWIEIFVFADRCGFVFVANLPILYLMAAKTQPIRVLTGYSYESLNIFHRRLGEIMCIEAILHALGMIGVWYALFKPSGFTFVEFMLEKICIIGLGALFAYELLYFTSLGSFRQRWYELFLGLHVVLQTAALVLLWLHHQGCRPYVAAAIVIFVLDRCVYRLGVKSQFVDANVEILEDGQTLRLRSDILIQQRNFLNIIFGVGLAGGWQATDHVFLTVPSLAHKHMIQAHPFTIASAAPEAGAVVSKLELLIRAQNGFSADLLMVAAVKRQLRVRLDGPYGSSHARDLLIDSDVALLIAGGSGVAVCWPLVRFLIDSQKEDFEHGKTGRRKRIILVWIIHKQSHRSWISSEELGFATRGNVEIVIPDATEDAGRPNLDAIIKDKVGSTPAGRRIGIVGSGPDSMGRAVRNTSARLIRNGSRVNVLIEKFGW